MVIITTYFALTPVISETDVKTPNCFYETRFKADFKVCHDRYITESIKKNVTLSIQVCLEFGSYFFEF